MEKGNPRTEVLLDQDPMTDRANDDVFGELERAIQKAIEISTDATNISPTAFLGWLFDQGYEVQHIDGGEG